MRQLRALITARPWLAALILALALAMKALIPGGYMIADGSKTLTITICDGISGADTHATIEVPAGHSPQDQHSGSDMAHSPCPYASLALSALGGADAPMLALAIAFVFALGFAPIRQTAPRPVRYLLPPLRGPPATA